MTTIPNSFHYEPGLPTSQRYPQRSPDSSKTITPKPTPSVCQIAVLLHYAVTIIVQLFLPRRRWPKIMFLLQRMIFYRFSRNYLCLSARLCDWCARARCAPPPDDVLGSITSSRAGCVRPLSLFYSDASADGVEERSRGPRSRSHARLRRNATMSHTFPCVQPVFIDL
ncbi:hypothetical protein EVAR_18168_1 [Eumeta japonica]|uniref:Uncharacterized protein n=1 Tax=Eumeta variegata TaxID=151549 RepID=A0A4C1UVQ3_EUMVA|nr:hypothetical protein EVAR_18168_1 [Eumeta japonica]